MVWTEDGIFVGLEINFLYSQDWSLDPVSSFIHIQLVQM